MWESGLEDMQTYISRIQKAVAQFIMISTIIYL